MDLVAQSRAALARDRWNSDPRANDLREMILGLQLEAGDLPALEETIRTYQSGPVKARWAAEAARRHAAAGNDEKAVALVGWFPAAEDKARLYQAMGMGRLDRGDKAGAADAFRVAVETAGETPISELPGTIGTEATTALYQAGDAAGARATAALTARTTSQYTRNVHTIYLVFSKLALAQVAAGDVDGAVGWIAALPSPDYRRSLYLQLADHLLRQAAAGEATGVLRLGERDSSRGSQPG